MRTISNGHLRRARLPAGLICLCALLFWCFCASALTAQETGDPLPPAEQEPVPAEGATPEDAQDEAPSTEEIARLINQLCARYYDDREDARDALERIGPPAEPQLIEALKHADFRVRFYAASVLGKIGSEACIGPILDAVHDEDVTVSAAAKQALQGFGAKALEAIERIKTTRPQDVAALDAMAAEMMKGGIEAALQRFVVSDGSIGFYPNMFGELVKSGKAVIPTLLEIVTDPGYEFITPANSEWTRAMLRRLAIDALGEIGDKSVVPELQKMAEGDIDGDFLQNSRGLLAEAAMFSLYKLGDTSYVDQYRKQLEETIEQFQGNDAQYRNELSVLLCRIQEYDGAMKELLKVIEQNPGEFIAHYNLACIYASRGQKANAMEAMRVAVQNGYTDHEWAMIDGDLASVREDAEFKSLVGEMKTKSGRRRRIVLQDGTVIELPEGVDIRIDNGLEPEPDPQEPPDVEEPPINDDQPDEGGDETPPEEEQ
ncbi:MAG: HEAT repeat domain-containing protein [Planctomycetota bacterium]|nr:HEAT repeat domain-containing protein [Planctomycetota bacterium]